MSIVNQVSQLYIGILGRAADRAGLEYWVQQVQTGKLTIEGVAKSFQEQPEWINGNGQLDRAGILNELYKNLFGREATGVDKAYWVLGEGASVPLEKLVLALIAPGAALGNDAIVLAQRTDAAVNFSFSDADTTDLDAAAAAITGVVSGSTFTLTTDADDRTGTDADDTFDAPLGAGAGGLVSQQTLQGFDKLDGGEGNDTLNAELNGFDSVIGAHNPTIANIEQYNLTVSADGAHGGLDLARASGYEVLQNINSRGDLTLDNVNLTDGEAPTIAVTNARAGTSTNVNYGTEVGAIETQNVEVSNVGSEDGNVALFIDTDGDGIGTLNLTASNGTNLFFDVDAGGVETLNLDVADGVELVLNDDADGIENLNITGQDELALEGTADFENLVNLNSEEYTGDLELNISGSEVLESVLTGDGDDVITADVDNFGDITTPTTVDLGQGENRLILRDGFSISAGELSSLDFTVNTVDNAQTLELVNVDLNGTASLGLDGVSALETLELRNFDSNGKDLSINGGPDDLTINAISNFTPAADFDMEGGQLTVNGVRNLVVNTGDDLAIDGGLKGHTLETLELNAADDADLFISTGSDVVNGELDALTSIEVNAGVAEGASNSDAYVHIDDMNGSLTTGLTALESISVAAQDEATLILNGTNDALTGAQTVLADAQAAQADAVTDLADAQAAQTDAEAALASAQADQDAKVLDQAAAEAAWAVAQAGLTAAEAAEAIAQADKDAAQTANDAAQAAHAAAVAELGAATAAVATFTAYLQDFVDNTFIVDNSILGRVPASHQNIAALNNYILANDDFTTEQKNELLALVPPALPLTANFNEASERDAFFNSATAFLALDYDIVGLTAAEAAAEAIATGTAADLAAADAALTTAQNNTQIAQDAFDIADDALNAADAALATANDAVADATDALLDAVVEVDHAEHALDDADAAVIAAQAAVEAALDDGTGFEALHTVTVEATDGDADVELTDVYGAVSLDVTAADNAWIDLFNTEVTSVTATAAHVDIDVAGDTVGNGALTSIIVTSSTANITLADNLESLETFDVVGVSTYLAADTSGADFGSMALGDFITYTIGATQDGTIAIDVDFTGNAAREVYDFAGGDIGEVVITGFTWGADPATGDRLDLSDFANGSGQLVFKDVGFDLVISDLNGGFGDFGGSITIIGAAGQGLDVAQYNIIYA